jgi:hypothetical protein
LKYFILLLIVTLAFLTNLNELFVFALQLLFFGFLLFDLRNQISNSFPLVPILSLLFYIENSFSLGLADALFTDAELKSKSYYLAITYNDYVYFGFFSSILYTIGLNQILNNKSLVKKQEIIFESLTTHDHGKAFNTLLLIGILGTALGFMKIEALNQITFVTSNFINCALFGLALKDRKISLKIVVPVLFQVINVINSAMYGDFLLYVLFFVTAYKVSRNIKTFKKTNWIYFIVIIAFGFFLLGFSQQLKVKQRESQWKDTSNDITTQSNKDESLISSIHKNSDYFSRDFFEPIIFRMNQAWLVSEVMAKQKDTGKFENGNTIMSAALDAFIPRFLDPNKEKAGGRNKIEKYTNLSLNDYTSMNIGVLGESYLNFGYYGTIFILFYGIFLGITLKTIINASIFRPILITVLPIYFMVFLVTGTDFVMIFNGLVKNTIIIYSVFIVAIPSIAKLEMGKKRKLGNQLLNNNNI